MFSSPRYFTCVLQAGNIGTIRFLMCSHGKQRDTVWMGISLSEADFESNNGPCLGFIELSPAFLAHPFLDL